MGFRRQLAAEQSYGPKPAKDLWRARLPGCRKFMMGSRTPSSAREVYLLCGWRIFFRRLGAYGRVY